MSGVTNGKIKCTLAIARSRRDEMQAYTSLNKFFENIAQM